MNTSLRGLGPLSCCGAFTNPPPPRGRHKEHFLHWQPAQTTFPMPLSHFSSCSVLLGFFFDVYCFPMRHNRPRPRTSTIHGKPLFFLGFWMFPRFAPNARQSATGVTEMPPRRPKGSPRRFQILPETPPGDSTTSPRRLLNQ